MNKVIFCMFYASILLYTATSCVETELVLPEVEATEDLGPIDIISKPSDVKIVGGYDYTFNVKWPNFSDKVSKVQLKYIDNGVEVIKEYSDFANDAIIETSQFGSYEIKLKSFSNTGLVSNEVTIISQNKGYIIEEILSNPLISTIDGEIEAKLFNPNGISYKLRFLDAVTNQPLASTFNSSASEFVAKFIAEDGTHDYLIELEDDKGRKKSKLFQYSFQYVLTTDLSTAYGVGQLTLSNNTPSKITKLKVSYPIAGGTVNTTEQSYNSNKGTFTFIPLDGTHNIVIDYEDEVGRKVNRTLSYTHLPFAFRIFNTAALKAGWGVKVSSNATNDGTGPDALKDGLANTYWHTPWSGTILPWPHHLTITFDKKIQLTKLILKIRHNNGNGAPKDFDLQISNDDNVYTTHQSYTNTVNGAGAVISFNIIPVETKYVRLLFKNNIANSTSMAIAEVDFEGNQNL